MLCTDSLSPDSLSSVYGIMAEGSDDLNGEFSNKSLLHEAREAVREVAFAVEEIHMADALPCTDECAFFNLKTKEGQTLCIEVSARGLQVVSEKYDTVEGSSKDKNDIYDTIGSLLNVYSPEYRRLFSSALQAKLNDLQQQRLQEEAP